MAFHSNVFGWCSPARRVAESMSVLLSKEVLKLGSGGRIHLAWTTLLLASPAWGSLMTKSIEA